MDQEVKPYFIGLDIGTSSAKAVAFNLGGKVLAQAAEDYELQKPEPDAAVQDAEEIRQATLGSLQKIIRKIGKAPQAIGLSSAMHSLLAVDEAGKALSPLITWADGRARACAEKLRGTPGGKYIYQHSGTPIHAMTPLCKLAWLREQQPELFRQSARFVGIKDYLLFHSFGEWLIDHSLASATGLFDLQKRNWLPEALHYAQLDADRLSRPVQGRHILCGMPEAEAETLGLSPQTPWVIGAADGCLANLGAGKLARDEAVLTIGTSGAVRLTVPEVIYDPQERIFCYILDEDHYVIGGPSNNGGVVWEWFCEQFFPDQSMDQVFDQVRNIEAGAAGLLFLPYIYGERAPVWDASAKGYFWDIEAKHSRLHFARAVLEGICLNIYQIATALEAVGGPIRRIHANGGFTQSEVWVQLLADVMGKEIVVRENPHASAWGAAIMAMQATGYTEIVSAEGMEGKIYFPNQANVKRYREVFSRFKQIYPSARVS